MKTTVFILALIVVHGGLICWIVKRILRHCDKVKAKEGDCSCEKDAFVKLLIFLELIAFIASWYAGYKLFY